MKTENFTLKGNSSNGNSRPGFLQIAIGGAGKDSVKSTIKQHEVAGEPFPVYTMAIDTDPMDFDKFEFSIGIAPTRDAVSAMASNPQKYGVACKAIIEYHEDLLDYETLGHGARTTRLVTQAAFELYEDRLIEGLRSAIHSLLRKGQCRRIQPVIHASFGGGTGSTGVILLQDFFMDEIRKREITLGLQPDLVAQPVLFAIDPYAHAMQQTNEDATRKILSNIYATRVELAEYEKKGKDYQYCFHLGLGNDAGAIFSTIPQVCEANGVMAWEWMAIYPFFKSRAVDGLDFHRKKGRFRGNVPELYYPKEFIPEYGERIVDVNKDEEFSDEKTSDQDENDTESTDLES
jgi:hypothetical protein